MTLKAFTGVDSFYRDIETEMEISHTEYMHRIIDKLGLENIARYIPFDIDYLKEKLKKDKHFNNTEIQAWDVAAGFIPYINRKTHTLEYNLSHSGLAYLFINNRITCFSVCEGVCVLKEAAKILCERENKNG